MYRLLLAWKWLLHRRVNILGIGGVTIAVWALIVVPGIFAGYVREIRAHVHRASADLSLILSGSAKPTSFARVEGLLGRRPEIAVLAPRFTWYGLILPKEPPEDLGTEPSGFFQVLGIDFARESPRLRPWIEAVKAEGLRARDPAAPLSAKPGALPRLLMGVEKAESLGLSIGDKVLLTTGVPPAARDGDIRTEVIEFELAGCFSSKHFEFDDFTVFCDIAVLRSRLAAEDGGPSDPFNEAAITLKPGVPLETAKLALQPLLDDARIYGRLFTWEEKQATFLESVMHQESILKLILLALMIIGTFLIFANLTMMVNEKIRDIGILNALGATRKGILSVFLTIGLGIAMSGYGFGVLLAWISCLNLDAFHDWLVRTFDLELFPSDIYGLKHIPYALDPAWILTVGAACAGLAALFSLIPSWRAARVDPVRSLHGE